MGPQRFQGPATPLREAMAERACFGGRYGRSLVVVMVMIGAYAVAPDIGGAGPRPFFALVRLVPVPVETRGGRRAGGDAVSGLREAWDGWRSKDCGQTDQSDCFEHGFPFPEATHFARAKSLLEARL